MDALNKIPQAAAVKAYFDCGQNETTVGYHNTKYWADVIVENYHLELDFIPREARQIALGIAEEVYEISMRETPDYTTMCNTARNMGLEQVKVIANMLENPDLFISDLHSLVTKDMLEILTKEAEEANIVEETDIDLISKLTSIRTDKTIKSMDMVKLYNSLTEEQRNAVDGMFMCMTGYQFQFIINQPEAIKSSLKL